MSERATATKTTTKLVVATWMAMCAVGMWQLAEHATEPGTTGTVATKLPAAIAQQLGWSFDNQLLVLCAHPQCPCLPASLDELSTVLAASPAVTLRILSFEPTVKPPSWDEQARATRFAGLPEGTAVLDYDGKLASELGATTSGHFSLFANDGDLTFAGGITILRGHRGDSQNRRALLSAINHPAPEPVRTVVYGCPLNSPCECNP